MLLKQATRLQLPPEHALDQLVRGDLVLPTIEDDVEDDLVTAATDSADALAAVQRLTTLFADVQIGDLEQQLNDPMLALINVDLEDLFQ